MNIENILKHSLFNETPQISNTDIVSYLTKSYSVYFDLLENLHLDNPISDQIFGNLEDIRFFSEAIIKTVTSYLRGQPSVSYSNFNEAMTKIWVKHLNLFSSKNYTSNSPYLYRCRYCNENEELTKDDLFHIPFEKRSLIRNQRYSINGHPSLYLGSSVFDCWVELNKPSLNQFVASKYFFRHKQFNCLDLAIDYKVIPKGLETIENVNYFQNWINQGIYTKFILFPLVFAVSIKSNPKDHFHVEYILPQLLLEWTSSTQNIDCIKYYSTRNYCNKYNTTLLTNLVFPVKTLSTQGYCQKLENLFSRSEPCKTTASYESTIGLSMTDILNDYHDSIFYRMENEICFKSK